MGKVLRSGARHSVLGRVCALTPCGCNGLYHNIKHKNTHTRGRIQKQKGNNDGTQSGKRARVGVVEHDDERGYSNYLGE